MGYGFDAYCQRSLLALTVKPYQAHNHRLYLETREAFRTQKQALHEQVTDAAIRHALRDELLEIRVFSSQFVFRKHTGGGAGGQAGGHTEDKQ